MNRFLFVSAAVLLLCTTAIMVFAAKEPRTGISFPEKFKGSHLSKLGVRSKGPIKVYAVGQYDKTFVLKMSHGVGAEKMSSALADALKPRCKDSQSVDEFKDMLVNGLPNGAPKGTELAFGTGGGKLSVAVNNKNVGSVSSKPLSKAFEGIYTDKNAVCELKPVGDNDDDDESDGGLNLSFMSPQNCAVVGAAVGYGIGKLLN